jgi:hypothetical protein
MYNRTCHNGKHRRKDRGLCISLSSAGSQGEVLANWEIGASFASIEQSYGRRIDCFGDGEV